MIFALLQCGCFDIQSFGGKTSPQTVWTFLCLSVWWENCCVVLSFKQSQEFDSAIVKRNSSPPLLCLSKNIFRGLCLKCSSLCNVKPPYHRLILYRFLNTLTKILKHAKNHDSSVFPSKNLVKYILPLFYWL